MLEHFNKYNTKKKKTPKPGNNSRSQLFTRWQKKKCMWA